MGFGIDKNMDITIRGNEMEKNMDMETGVNTGYIGATQDQVVWGLGLRV